MINIHLDNVYARIEYSTKEIDDMLWKEISFTVEEYGVQEIRTRHLYNRKTKKTYAGLLSYVTEIFDREGYDYKIIDNRNKHEPNADFKLVDYIELSSEEKIALKARPYQKNLITMATEREVIQCATGGGG